MKKLPATFGAAALGLLPALAAPAGAPPPNVLIITTDQQSWNMMSVEGTKPLSTPALDRLANDGYRFRRAYASNPLCMPSRFSLYTGHYSSEIGIKDNTLHPANKQRNIAIATESGMGSLFRKAGYDTFYAGKVHLYSPTGQPPAPLYGFQMMESDPYEGPVDFAKKFFAGRKPNDKPFLMVLSFMNPHNICEQAGIGRNPATLKNAESNRLMALQKKLTPAQYAAQIPPMPFNTALINGEQPTWVSSDALCSRTWSKSDWALYLWLYFRLTESVDDQIGRALAAFYASPFAANTIVVFTSDHGDMAGAHSLSLKNHPFEECQRIPFVFRGPGIKKGVADDTLVCNGLDLLPTLCDLTSVPYPKTLPGKSLKGLLTGTAPAPERDCIYMETRNSYTLHDGRYKYTVFELPGNPEMLVDLQTDPGELRNLADDKSSNDIKQTLKNKLMKNLAARNLLPLRTDPRARMQTSANPNPSQPK